VKNKIFVIHGATYSGKSRLALTAPSPMLFMDSDMSADQLLSNHARADQINVVRIKDWAQLRHQLKVISEEPNKSGYEKMKGRPMSVVLDGGSFLTTWAYIEAQNDVKKGEDAWINASKKIDDFIVFCKQFPANIIITAKDKERYESGQFTGDMVININRHIEYAADVVVRCDGVEGDRYVYTIEKDREHSLRDVKVENLTFGRLVSIGSEMGFSPDQGQIL